MTVTLHAAKTRLRTQVVAAVTTTVTRTFRRQAAGVSSRQEAEPMVGDPVRLLARHVCPICPSNSGIVSPYSTNMRSNGNSAVNFCCPRRRIVTKTRTRKVTKTLATKTVFQTKSVTATRTVVAMVQNITGRLFVSRESKAQGPPGPGRANDLPVCLCFRPTPVMEFTRPESISLFRTLAFLSSLDPPDETS